MADKTKADPAAALQKSRKEIVANAAEASAKRLKLMLRRAQGSLNDRLKKAEGLGGPGADSFTAVQLRATMAQIELVLHELKTGIKSAALDASLSGVEPSVKGVIEYLRAAEKRFAGVAEKLPISDAVLFDRARSGAESSALHRLEGDPKKGPGILDRYGDAVVEQFEGRLQQRLLARTPWADVRNQIIADSPFLQQAPAHWAERIVRTEAMNGSNRAIWEANKAADDVLGDVVKILCATFDNRTGSDSIAVHGQIRKPEEAFQWWEGLYQHPPNRPNDREVVVTHRLSWPIPDELKWRSDSEVTARWLLEGRKGSPPARPKMTTIPLEKFGATPPPKPKAPPKPPIIEPPEIPQKPARGPVASPFFDENVEPFHSPPDRPARAAHAPKKPVNFMHAAEGGQKGSNEGGFYRGDDGVLRYVKFYKDPVQAELEHLTNNIYRDLGLPAVKSEVFTAPDGRKGYVSEVLEGETLAKKGINKIAAKKVMKGFAADVLVGNWDAVGLEHDNVVLAGGHAVRIDNGGALLHRAKAGLKPESVLNKIDEWEKFFDPSVNPAYAKVAKAAGVSSAEDVVGLKGQLEAIRKLKNAHGSWGAYVDHVSPNLPPDVRKKVVTMLSERARLLDDKRKGLKAAKLKKPKGGGVGFDELPEGPLPSGKHLPEGIGDRYEYQRQVRQKLDELQARDRSLSPAIRDYTASGYGIIRDAGRMTEEEFKRAHGEYSGRRYAEYRKQFEALDKAFEGAPPVGPESKVKEAFRGIGDLSRAAFDRIIASKHFEASTVTSTAWDPDVAKRFMRGESSYSVMFHFKPDPGSRNWLAVETHSSMGTGETEILLRKGAKFRVTEVRKSRSRRNAAVIELEEIGSHEPVVPEGKI